MSVEDLYIPHGSDNTQEIKEAIEFVEETLYPTWFR